MRVLYWLFRTAGVFLVCLGFFLLLSSCIADPAADLPPAAEGTNAYAANYCELLGFYSTAVVILPLCGVLAMVCFLVSDRLRCRRRKQPVNLRAPYILYLRSFAADKTTAKVVDPVFSGGRSEEEEMMEVLSEIAPVVAIGCPQDRSLPWGAGRIYVEEAEWKTKVEEMVTEAKLVVLRLGETRNFWWEVQTCLEKCDMAKLLFVIPVSRRFKEAVELAGYLEKHGVNISELPLSIDKPGKGSVSSLLFLGKDRRVLCENVKFPRFTFFFLSYQEILRNALAELFDRFGLPRRHMLPARKVRVFFLLFIIAAIIISPFYIKISIENALRESYPNDLLARCETIPEFQAAAADFSDSRKLREAWLRLEAGLLCLPDKTVACYFLLNAMACQKMTQQEFTQFEQTPRATVTLIKKYLPDAAYQDWLKICGDAVAVTFTGASAVPVKESEVQKELEKLSASKEFAEATEKGERACLIAMANLVLEMRQEGLNAGKFLKYIWQSNASESAKEKAE